MFFIRLTVDLNTGLTEVFNHPKVSGSCDLIGSSFRRSDGKRTTLNIDAFNFAFLGLVHKLRIARGRFISHHLLSAVKLLKYSKQH